MYSLYGRDLPKKVRVEIPSYGLFKYSESLYDGSDLYQDSLYNRTGVYHVWLYEYTKNIDTLVSWMYSELIASGTRIHIKNRILSSGDTISLADEGSIPISSGVDLTSLYEDPKFVSVNHTTDHGTVVNEVVALKSVDEYRYIKRIPDSYAVRVLKYNNADETGLLYYIELLDESLTLSYGYSSNLIDPPETLTDLGESTIVESLGEYLWVRYTVGSSTRTVPVILKDVGQNWYIQYTLVGSEYVDWITWTSTEADDPYAVIYTNDPSQAIGLYIRADLRELEYPLCSYTEISLYSGSTGSGDLMRSAAYASGGVNEYSTLGTLIASKQVMRVSRSKDMTDVIEFLLIKEGY
jgi:hypothetical protein